MTGTGKHAGEAWTPGPRLVGLVCTIVMFLAALVFFSVGIYIDVSLDGDVSAAAAPRAAYSRHFTIFMYVIVAMVFCSVVTLLACALPLCRCKREEEGPSPGEASELIKTV